MDPIAVPLNAPAFADNNDKYKDKLIRFYEKKDHYELLINGDIPSVNSNLIDVYQDMSNANASKELHVFINTPGGDVNTLIYLLQQIKTFEHIITICSSNALSCGFILWAAGDERFISPYGYILHHPSKVLLSSYTNSPDIQSIASNLDMLEEAFINNTFIKDILTEAELKASVTKDVYIAGSELIKRKAAKNFSEYGNRIKITPKDLFFAGNKYFLDTGLNAEKRLVEVDVKDIKSSPKTLFSIKDLYFMQNKFIEDNVLNNKTSTTKKHGKTK